MGAYVTFTVPDQERIWKQKGTSFGRRTNLPNWNTALSIFLGCTLKVRKKIFSTNSSKKLSIHPLTRKQIEFLNSKKTNFYFV